MLVASFYITLFLLSLNQLSVLSKSGGVSVYLFDISVILFSLFGTCYFLILKKSFKIPRYAYFYIIFLLPAGISLFLSSVELPTGKILTGFFYLLRYFSYLLSGVVVYNMVDKRLLSKKRIEDAFILSGIFIAIAGFIQLILLPDFTILDPSLGWDPHKNRLASTFFDPNFVGAYFVICLAVLLERIFPDKGTKGSSKTGFYTYFCLIVILIGLILTFSRSAWGMMGIVVLAYGVFRSKVLLLVAFFTAFLAYFAIPRVQTRISGTTDPADSASLRIVSWGNTVRIIKDNIWTGVGFNTYRYAQEKYGFLTPDQDEIHSGAGSDSSLLLVFATTGILGFLIYFVAFLFPIIDSLKKRYLGWLVILSILISLLIESQFINSLFYPQIMFILFPILFIFDNRLQYLSVL